MQRLPEETKRKENLKKYISPVNTLDFNHAQKEGTGEGEKSEHYYNTAIQII